MMRFKKSVRLMAVTVGMLLAGFACGDKKTTGTSAVQPALASTGEASSGGTVIARFNGKNITDEDIRKVAGPKLAQAELGLYEARKSGLDQIMEEDLLSAEATKKGTSKDKLLKDAVYDKIKIEDKDVAKFYNENKTQMQGKSLDDAKSNIKGYLFRQKYQDLYGKLTDDLRKKADIEVLIKAPRINVDEGEDPASIGPKDAPVKVIEFTDYQCPFCGRARPTVNQIISTYKGKVRYVLRDFPLSFHKDSIKAHEAAYCAMDQGKYWDFNHKLFENQKDLGIPTLKKYASEIKLNQKKFDECLDSGKYTQKVQKNQQYGESVGVSGTPAFFVNGRMLSGARPFDSFKEIIDDELRSNK